MAREDKADKRDMEPAKGGIVQGADGKPALANVGGGGSTQGSSGSASVLPQLTVKVTDGDPVEAAKAVSDAMGGYLDRVAAKDEHAGAIAIQKVGTALAHLDRIHAPGAIMETLLARIAHGLVCLDYECSPDRASEALPFLRAMAESSGKADAAQHIGAAIKALE